MVDFGLGNRHTGLGLASVYRFSVRSPDPLDKRKLDEWNENVLKNLVNCRYNPAETNEAFLAGWATDLGRIQIGRVKSSRGSSRRDKALVTATEDDRFNLLVPVGDGIVSTSQRGVETTAAPGGIAMVRMEEAADVQFQTVNDSYLVFLPKKELLSRCPNFNDRDAARALQGGPVAAMIGAYLRLVEQQGEAALGLLAPAIANHLMDLVLLSLDARSDNREAATKSIRTAKVTEARAYVKANFANPAASLDRCASQLCCSRSYLQKALAAEGTGFSDMLRRHRVEMACNLLRSEAGAGRPLIDIAFSCGFIDLSTFYRAFKTETGMPPGEFKSLLQ